MSINTVLLGLLAVVLTLLLWNLRWVLLIVFGAVVVSVALDELIALLQSKTRLQRPQALVAVLGLLVIGSSMLGQLLLPELIEQVQQLGRDLPQLIEKVSSLLRADPRLTGLSAGLEGDWTL
ncbi:MAG: AI-2E family transporter, partial [Synechococcus sp.]